MDIKRLFGITGAGSPTAPVTSSVKENADATGGWISDDYLPGQKDRLQEATSPTVQPNHDPEPPGPDAPVKHSSQVATLPASRLESAPAVLNVFDDPTPSSVEATPSTNGIQKKSATEKAPEQPASFASVTSQNPAASTAPLNIPVSKASEPVSILRNIGNSLMSVFGKGDATLAMRPILSEINALEPQMRALTDKQLQGKTTEFKARIAAGETEDQLLPEAFAAVREAARRVNGTRPFDVQMLGGLALHQGKIAEMRTGEGKTLTAVMPVYLNALSGKGAHVVTVNETLAQRDCSNMGKIYNFMGLSTGVVLEKMSPDEKRKGYNADVTYITNSSLGFDYLRDNMARDSSQVVQRDPNFAVVDEVDEILIDEARTPLIVSELSEPSAAMYTKFNGIVAGLKPGDDYKVDRKQHSAWLTDEGQDKVEKTVGLDMYSLVDNKMLDEAVQAGLQSGQPVAIEFGSKEEVNAYLPLLQAKKIPVTHSRTGIPVYPKPGTVALIYPEGPVAKKPAKGSVPPSAVDTSMPPVRIKAESLNHMDMITYLNAALKAHTLFTREKDYIVTNGKVEIVDEFTGHVMDGRRYNDGIHQALEAKEGVEVQPEQKTMASITYPNLFRRYNKLAGMSGTAKTEEAEFRQLYGLETAVIAPNKPSQRIDKPDMIYKTADEKFKAIADEVEKLYNDGQPVLVGTRSIGVNQYLDRLLAERNIPHQVLNAMSVKDNTASENDTLALAGKSGMVTIATNMAGRGVDIKPDMVNFKKLTGEALGQLQNGSPVGINLANKADAESLLFWLYRNGAPTTTAQAGTSADKLEAGKVTLLYPGSSPADIAPMMEAIRNKEKEAAFAAGEPEPAAEPPLQFPMSKPGVIVESTDFPSGGLYVLGTERHESRRIDNQLLGRSARQGDPGTTQFYVSLDDELMRYFGGEKLKSVFTSFGIGPGQALSDKMVDKAIGRAQEKVESANFDMRTNTTKYDTTLNIQRKIIYDERKKILDGADLKPNVLEWADAKIDKLAAEIKTKRGKVTPEDARLLTDQVKEFFGFAENMEPQCLYDEKPVMTQLLLELKSAMRATYFDREAKLTGEGMAALSKDSMLNAMDDEWHMHIDDMSYLQQGIGWVAMAEKDPEREYAKQGFEMFQDMKQHIEERAMEDIFKTPLIPNTPMPNLPSQLTGLKFPPGLSMANLQGTQPSFGGFLNPSSMDTTLPDNQNS